MNRGMLARRVSVECSCHPTLPNAVHFSVHAFALMLSSHHRPCLATSGVFFFFTMEFLQGLQYFVIADNYDDDAKCNQWINQVLTLAGFAHICLQPYFCHVINASLTKSEKYLWQYRCIKRLCLIGGFLLFCRFLLAHYNIESTMFGVSNTMDAGFLAGADTGKSTEWLRGEKICTFNGKYHLAWSIPMADPSYLVPGAQIHSFLMYAPFFALWEKKGMIVQGAFLFLTGPALAAYFTPNLFEQASIWCFFSIGQITSMLFLIRETLILEWGTDDHRTSLLASKAAEGKPVRASRSSSKAAASPRARSSSRKSKRG